MTPRPWKLGDPVGCGAVFLPTRKHVEDYTAECNRLMIEADARAICAMPDLRTRQARIARYPEKWRDTLKRRVREMWDTL